MRVRHPSCKWIEKKYTRKEQREGTILRRDTMTPKFCSRTYIDRNACNAADVDKITKEMTYRLHVPSLAEVVVGESRPFLP